VSSIWYRHIEMIIVIIVSNHSLGLGRTTLSTTVKSCLFKYFVMAITKWHTLNDPFKVYSIICYKLLLETRKTQYFRINHDLILLFISKVYKFIILEFWDLDAGTHRFGVTRFTSKHMHLWLVFGRIIIKNDHKNSKTTLRIFIYFTHVLRYMLVRSFTIVPNSYNNIIHYSIINDNTNL